MNSLLFIRTNRFKISLLFVQLLCEIQKNHWVNIGMNFSPFSVKWMFQYVSISYWIKSQHAKNPIPTTNCTKYRLFSEWIRKNLDKILVFKSFHKILCYRIGEFNFPKIQYLCMNFFSGKIMVQYPEVWLCSWVAVFEWLMNFSWMLKSINFVLNFWFCFHDNCSKHFLGYLPQTKYFGILK